MTEKVGLHPLNTQFVVLKKVVFKYWSGCNVDIKAKCAILWRRNCLTHLDQKGN